MSGFNIFSNKLNNLFNAFGSKDKRQKCEEASCEKEGISVDDENSYLTTNRSLWRAVILQSIIDIVNNSSRTENKIAKIEAKQWVFKENEDFYEVCNLAGYNAKYVRKKIMEIMRQNLVSKIIINKMSKEEKCNFNVINGGDNYRKSFDYEKKIMFNY
jgi:hypothetical protein